MADRSIAEKRSPAPGVALALAFLFSMPAAGAEDPRDREIAALEKRVMAFRQQMVVDKVEIDRLRQEVAELREALESLRSAGRPVVEPPPVEGPTIAPQPAIETSDLEVDPVRTESAESSDEAAPDADFSSDDLQAVYDEGYTLFHQKRYQEAERRFAAFLAGGGDTDLVDNAQFWIGECRYARGDLAAALEAFTAVVERYPTGNKVPDAMVKAGKTLEALGDTDAARATFEEVRTRFPGTAAAATATELLERLR